MVKVVCPGEQMLSFYLSESLFFLSMLSTNLSFVMIVRHSKEYTLQVGLF